MAVDSMVRRLLDERDTKMALIDQIAGIAEDEGRDLLESDNQTIESAQARVRSLNDDIDRLTQNLELAESAKNRIRTLDPTIVAKDFTYRTAGEFLWDVIHRSDEPDCGLRLNKFMSRAAEHMGFDKANTVPVAGGYNGLVVIPSVGPVLDPSPAGRPLFSALGAQTVTSVTFTRPRLVDPNFETGVGIVTQEKSEMPSKAWDILAETVTCSRVGGYINVSEVLVEMLAGSLDMVITHMNRRVAAYSEKAVVTELAKSTATVAVATDDVNAAIGEAAALVVTNTGQLPTWLAMGPAGWGALLGKSDLAGRPLYPAIGPVNTNATGKATEYFTSMSGLNVAVTPAITDKTLYMGNSFGLEIYERPMPLMQAFEPSVYGRQVAVATYLGFYSAITEEGATPKREGTVKITWA
jgi:HK97 family phage major capsid protein